ncbi:retrovirus-related pol polyprotein from transposon TNT 1-94 [Tanacetum coccineum]
MLNGSVLSKHFWTEAVKIACYTQNRSIIVKRHDKTSYEIFRKRIPDMSYFHVFGFHVFIHNYKDYLGKFDAKADDRYFLGYSFVLKAFRVFNIMRQQIEKTYHVTFDKSMEAIKFTNTLIDEIGIDDLSRYPPDEFLHEDDPSRQYKANSDFSYYIIPHDTPHTEDIKGPPDLTNTKGIQEQNVQVEQINSQPTEEFFGNYTETLLPITESLVPKVISSQSMLTRSMAAKLIAALASECVFADFLSEIEPKKKQSLDSCSSTLWKDSHWLQMGVRNKKDELETIIKNKARLVAQGYSQEEGIDYDKIFAPIARMEAIRIFFAFATYMNFKVFQMDVKSTFQNRKLKEEVYVKQLLLVPSCRMIFDLEPLSLSFDFVFTSEIFKSLSFSLDRLCHLAILCLDQHAHTLHLLESSLIIFPKA